MGQTHRRIDPIDAAACLSKCLFLRASDALDVSARRGVRVAPEASHPPLSTQTIRRPGGRAEDAIVEGTYPQNTGIPDPGIDPDAALASNVVASAQMAEVHAWWKHGARNCLHVFKFADRLAR